MLGRARTGRRGDGELVLTPMVDMFTLLIVYLIQGFGSGDESLLGKQLTLPVAHHASDVERRASVVVVGDSVLVDGVAVAALHGDGRFIEPLRAHLAMAREQGGLHGVNLLADRTLSHGVLRRVLDSCGEAGIASVNLAVIRN